MSFVLFVCGLFCGLTVTALGPIGLSIHLWREGAFENHYTKSMRGKKSFLFSVSGLGIAGAASSVLWQVTGPDHAGVIVVAASVPVTALTMTGAFWLAPTVAVAYGSWWQPAGGRAAYRQDMRVALARVTMGPRGKHAWQMITSGPRAGLRARRFAARCVGPTAASGHPPRRTER
ncbi:hypothetical protein QBA35_09850 [Streptomyces bottropensis]|uniref:Uncharacterized protein n=1 Tax=Streptomyces bottropensis TaxID=42235 RepID=A0ABU8AKE2_9ACTN